MGIKPLYRARGPSLRTVYFGEFATKIKRILTNNLSEFFEFAAKTTHRNLLERHNRDYPNRFGKAAVAKTLILIVATVALPFFDS